MPKAQSLEEVFVEDLKDLMDAEKLLIKTLPKLAKKASTDELRSAFEEHLEQTEEHVERLNRIFDQLNMRPAAKKCDGMRGIIAEGSTVMSEVQPGPTLDAALIGAAQKTEHYEISAYGTARTYANRLGHSEIAALLEQTLEEEKATDVKLTEIAESRVNEEAAQEPVSEQTRGRASRGGARRSAAADRGGTSRGRQTASRTRK